MDAEKKVLLTQKKQFGEFAEPNFGGNIYEKDSNFSFEKFKQETLKNYEKLDIEKNTHSTHFPNIKADKAFDENPLTTEEGYDPMPTESFNERETANKFYEESLEESKIKTQNREKRLQSLTRSSLSSEKGEDKKLSRSLERPGKSSSINQFSSQIQFNRETDPDAFKRYENEASMSTMPLSFNLEDLAKEEEKLSEIFDFLKREWDPSAMCDDWWELTEDS